MCQVSKQPLLLLGHRFDTSLQCTVVHARNAQSTRITFAVARQQHTSVRTSSVCSQPTLTALSSHHSAGCTRGCLLALRCPCQWASTPQRNCQHADHQLCSSQAAGGSWASSVSGVHCSDHQRVREGCMLCWNMHGCNSPSPHLLRVVRQASALAVHQASAHFGGQASTHLW